MIRRSLPLVITAAALAAAGAASATAAAPTEAHATSVRLANDWSSWTAGRSGVTTTAIGRSRARTLRITLPRGTPRGTLAFYRLTLPKGVSPTTLTFRASFSTTGAQAFIASGTLGRRVWTRADRSGRKVVARAALGGRRVIYVGIIARTWLWRSAVVRIHSYAISTSAVRTPLPRTSAPGAVVPVDDPAPGRPPATGDLPSGPRIYWGARIGGSVYGAGYTDAPWDTRTLSLFEQHAGKGVSLVLWGQPWYSGGAPQTFDPVVMNTVRHHGAIPVLDWSPWDLANGGVPNQPAFQLSDIISGQYDGYIRDWAEDAAAWGHPFFLRFCHEMNGSWYPWSEAANGNSSGQFAQAWRHVHDIFVQEGATNVSWVWAPNEIEGWNGIPLAGLYPGSSYVDWAGMSGYNWGTFANGSQWRSFTNTFTRTYASVRSVAPGKPLMITETGSSEKGGSKADWIRDAFQVQLPNRFPAVKAVVWWNRPDEGLDWPIETSAASQSAFAASIASSYYAPNAFANLSASPIPAP